jgi:PAS domain-containing protein
MTTLHMLTIRTNAALGRLASLQRRAEKAAAPTRSVVRPALKELNDALEELQVANDQLQTQVEELADAKLHARTADQRFAELLEWLPCACVWTSTSGEVLEANPAAAALLNVSAQHLAGRPLLLFMTERAKFSEAMSLLTASAGSVVASVGIRPRERRTRQVQLVGRKRAQDDRLCWFLVEGPVNGHESAGAGLEEPQPPHAG